MCQSYAKPYSASKMKDVQGGVVSDRGRSGVVRFGVPFDSSLCTEVPISVHERTTRTRMKKPPAFFLLSSSSSSSRKPIVANRETHGGREGVARRFLEARKPER